MIDRVRRKVRRPHKAKRQRRYSVQSTDTDEPPIEIERRAMATAKHLTDLAAAGIPAFAQLKARNVKFFARVEKKLEAVPAERRQPPPANIAAPAALQYALLGDGDDVAELREMFENLLVVSADRDTAANAHPAFVSMISQLTPDEARILKSIDRNAYEYFDLVKPKGLQTILGLGIGIKEGQIDFCISNLVRLGIIQLHTGTSGEYKDASPELIQLVDSRFPVPDMDVIAGRQFLLWMHVTALGQQFLDTCVRPRGR